MAACTRCAELARTRTQTVFGVGNPHARLVFLGEAPGADEDRQGEPFVGKAGQLLTKIIESLHAAARGCLHPATSSTAARRATATRCPSRRPTAASTSTPNSRSSSRSSSAASAPWPPRTCWRPTSPIGRLRGRFHDYQGIKVICTYHPAYVLRNPSAKRDVWTDIQLLMAEMGLPLQ